MGSNASTLLDLRDLGAEGRVRVILTRNIGTRSIDKDKVIHFLRLRGTEAFASAIRGLTLKKASGNIPFVEDKLLPHIEIGYDLEMLNEVMLTQEFMPLYGLRESPNKLPAFTPPAFTSFQDLLNNAIDDLHLTQDTGRDVLIKKMVAVLQKAWRDWGSNGSEEQTDHYPKRIMLSRYGLFQVILDRKLNQESENRKNLLSDIIQPVQLLGKRVYDALDDPSLAQSDAETSSDDKADKAAKAAEDAKALKVIKDEISNKASIITEPSEANALRRLRYYSVQWELAREILYQFLGGVKSKVKKGTDKDVKVITQILANLPAKEKERAPLTSSVYNSRFRYIIYEIEEFKDIVGGAQVQVPEDLIRQAIASLLENAPVEQAYNEGEQKRNEPDSSRTHIATPSTLVPHPAKQESNTSDSSRTYLQNMKPERQKALFQQDVATWEGEYCLFTHDNALIYYSKTIRKLKGADYTAYWGSVLRAIRYYTEVRLGLKLLDIYSSRVLEKLTELLPFKAAKPKIGAEDLAKLYGFETQAINSARILARLRYQAAPTTVGSSDYAIMKYERLRKVLAVGEYLESAKASIDTILDLLSRYRRF